MYAILLLLCMGGSLFGGSFPVAGDPIPESLMGRLKDLDPATKGGTLIVVQDDGAWRYAEFRAKMIDGDIAVLIKPGHGAIKPVDKVKSIVRDE